MPLGAPTTRAAAAAPDKSQTAAALAAWHQIDAALRDAPSAERARLYTQAAELAFDPGQKRFLLTHAWVHALSAGDALQVSELELALRALGGL
ncbi:MAG: hypothetical protein AAGE13_01015 [Pseudomonadota bacterium]